MTVRAFRILVAFDAGPLRALEVMKRIRADSAIDVPSIPAFYRFLKEQIDTGTLEIARTSSDGGRGRPQNVYRLTEAGRAQLREQAERMQAMAALVLRSAQSTGK